MLGMDFVTRNWVRHGIQFHPHDDVTSAAPYMPLPMTWLTA
jgi:hypothetical protein